MRSIPGNPASNSLPPGLNQKELLAAITSSGYPLQGVVARQLSKHFSVFEERGYVDDATNEHRSLDVHAFKWLDAPPDGNEFPGLILLIECKRSKHPFIFFKQVEGRAAPSFPVLGGLPQSEIRLRANDTGSIHTVSARQMLGLAEHPFVRDGAPTCAVFTKGVPKGQGVELSGSDPFNTIVLPLVKAIRHTTSSFPRIQQHDRMFPMLVLSLAVLDAPMLLVESPETAADPVLCPWVRVVRHEAGKSASGAANPRFYTMDAVHADFLLEYIDGHVLPFAQVFAQRVLERQVVLRSAGSVPTMSGWSWDTVTPSANW